LWMKGESSGHVLDVAEILVDCDQDALVLKVRPAGPTCHTGATSCFYRRLDGEGLVRVVD
jgi:phosphoribosyl-AMP cyclohydrolase